LVGSNLKGMMTRNVINEKVGKGRTENVSILQKGYYRAKWDWKARKLVATAAILYVISQQPCL